MASKLPLSLRKKLRIMQAYPSYADAYTTDMTDAWQQEIVDRAELGKNTIIEIVGETGSGKTYAGFNIGAHLQKPFKKRIAFDNFCFTNTNFIKKVQLLGKRNTLIKDEQPRQIWGEGSVIEQVTLQDIEEVVRKTQLNMIFISPSSRAFHTGVHYILQTFNMDYIKRECTLLLHEQRDHSLIAPFGSIRVKHPVDEFPYLKPVIEQYENEKDEFIKDATNRTSRAEFFRELNTHATMLEKDSAFMKIKGLEDRMSYVYKYYPELASQFSVSLLERIIRMSRL